MAAPWLATPWMAAPWMAASEMVVTLLTLHKSIFYLTKIL